MNPWSTLPGLNKGPWTMFYYRMRVCHGMCDPKIVLVSMSGVMAEAMTSHRPSLGGLMDMAQWLVMQQMQAPKPRPRTPKRKLPIIPRTQPSPWSGRRFGPLAMRRR